MFDRIVRAGCLALVLLTASPGHAAAGPATLDALAAAFRDAFAAGDRDAALALFYWAGVDDQRRDIIEFMVDADLAREIAEIEVLDVGEAPIEFSVDGVMNQANLPVVGHLLAEFRGAGGATHYSLHMLGLKDGVYYISLAVPGVAL